MNQAMKARYKVVYDLVVRPSDAERSSGEVALYVIPPMRRLDADIRRGPARNAKTSLYLADGKLYLCSQVDSPSCVKTSRDSLRSLPYKAALDAMTGMENPQDVAHVYLGTDIQARTPSYCWELTQKEAGAKETIELCASVEGIPMSIVYLDNHGTRVQLRATSVTRQVSEEDVKMPVEP